MSNLGKIGKFAKTLTSPVKSKGKTMTESVVNSKFGDIIVKPEQYLFSDYTQDLNLAEITPLLKIKWEKRTWTPFHGDCCWFDDYGECDCDCHVVQAKYTIYQMTVFIPSTPVTEKPSDSIYTIRIQEKNDAEYSEIEKMNNDTTVHMICEFSIYNSLLVTDELKGLFKYVKYLHKKNAEFFFFGNFRGKSIQLFYANYFFELVNKIRSYSRSGMGEIESLTSTFTDKHKKSAVDLKSNPHIGKTKKKTV
jgi:hypothetical protein